MKQITKSKSLFSSKRKKAKGIRCNVFLLVPRVLSVVEFARSFFFLNELLRVELGGALRDYPISPLLLLLFFSPTFFFLLIFRVAPSSGRASTAKLILGREKRRKCIVPFLEIYTHVYGLRATVCRTPV